jgi:cytochrome P450
MQQPVEPLGCRMTPQENEIHTGEESWWQDPYGNLAAVREHYRTGVTSEGLKAILRWEDAEDLLKGDRFENEGLEFIERRGFRPGDALYEWRRYSIGALNGEDHRRIRSLVSRALTHRSVDGMRPRIREHARNLLRGSHAAGEIEARASFAQRLPFLTITDFLGIELEEALTVAEKMGQGSADAFGPRVTQEIRDNANGAFAAMMEFVGELYENRRSEPREDLLTDLIQAEEGGDRLSHEELIVLFTNIFGGAIETTASVITSGLFELACHPKQAALLRSDPERWKHGATEEILRHRPGFYAAGKRATCAHEAYGLAFEEGESISILIGGPNRDPARWEDPDRFDITRDPRNWSLSFSMGEHFCLGQALARAEIQEAMQVFVTECDVIELVEQPRWMPYVMVNRLESLSLRYRPASA